KPAGALPPIHLPGVLLAALATLSFGAVLGPEAPLIATGSGLGVLAVRLAARDAPPTAATVIAAAGSFAAIASLFGSPLLAAFLLLEAAGLSGPMVGLVLVPVLGLVIAGFAILFDQVTGKGSSLVLFSGQSGLPQLVSEAAHWPVGTMLLLVACKGLAYALSLSSFRGGPVFPAMFVGA